MSDSSIGAGGISLVPYPCDDRRKLKWILQDNNDFYVFDHIKADKRLVKALSTQEISTGIVASEADFIRLRTRVTKVPGM